MVPELCVQGLCTVAPSLGGQGVLKECTVWWAGLFWWAGYSRPQNRAQPPACYVQPRLSPPAVLSLLIPLQATLASFSCSDAPSSPHPLPLEPAMNAVPSAWSALPPVPPTAASFSAARFHSVITCSELLPSLSILSCSLFSRQPKFNLSSATYWLCGLGQVT